MTTRVIRNITQIDALSNDEKRQLVTVTQEFEFRVSAYYAGLIDWSDPDDPLRRIVLPSLNELNSDLDFDASNESANTPVRGLQHKYRATALLLVNDVCAAYCRFCFRKRFTLATSRDAHIVPEGQMDAYERETTFNVQDGLDYIARHPEIDNVLLTGGDPLMLSASRLEPILAALRAIPHVKIIRIGSKVPAFDPERLTDDLLDMLARYSLKGRRLYLMAHFNHPRELTALAKSRLSAALKRGIIIYNQTPLLRGINDDPYLLRELFNELAAVGVRPYYLFHCRPTKGNESFMLSMQEGIRIVDAVRTGLSGLAKCFFYAGSHASGKIEIVGQQDNLLVFRYHQPKHQRDQGRIITWPADIPVMWFDAVDLNPIPQDTAAAG